jgi:hypothetical protein
MKNARKNKTHAICWRGSQENRQLRVNQVCRLLTPGTDAQQQVQAHMTIS